MLTLPDMIANSAPNHFAETSKMVAATQPRCADCPSLAARHHPAGIIGPHGTSARCITALGGARMIGWEWKPADPTPAWCPRRAAGATKQAVAEAASLRSAYVTRMIRRILTAPTTSSDTLLVTADGLDDAAAHTQDATECAALRSHASNLRTIAPYFAEALIIVKAPPA